MKHFVSAIWIALALTPIFSFGQGEKVLSVDEVNESTLIEALELTRTIVPVPTPGVKSSSPRPSSASMLITFATNSSELTLQAKKMLDTLGRAMQSERLAGLSFSIEGHADPRGGVQFNQQLSQERADRVVTYLEVNQMIEPRRLRAIGKGQSELLNRANPEAPENRRITVKTLRGYP